jgi:peptidoglycan/xylan/chitin deacetylase (PgdA/CDA1 family)
MEAEMSDNRDFLQNLTGREVAHFAYPYGTDKACGDREFAAARRLGFRSGTTATSRSVGHGSSRHALPRLDLTGRFWTSRAEGLASAFNAGPAALNCLNGTAERKLP